MSPDSQVACSGEDSKGHEPEVAGSGVGRKPTFLKEEAAPELDADQEERPGVPPRGHLPGGTPEEMVEADTWPWPLAVMAATSMVYVVSAVRPVTRYSRVTLGR